MQTYIRNYTYYKNTHAAQIPWIEFEMPSLSETGTSFLQISNDKIRNQNNNKLSLRKEKLKICSVS